VKDQYDSHQVNIMDGRVKLEVRHKPPN